MRVTAVAHESVGGFDHLGRDVGVVVETDRDRNILPEHRADAAQQFALTILETFAHHGAVQVEIHRIDRHSLAEPPNQFTGYALVGIGGHWSARAATGPQQRHDL